MDELMAAFAASAEPGRALYHQLYLALRHLIATGVLKPGARLVTENEIVRELSLSRTTVRLAMNRLEEEGIIVRQRGRGTFLASEPLKRSINHMYNFTENMRDSGAVPSSVVLEQVVETAAPEVAEQLRLPLSHPIVFTIKRLRCADGTPLIVETSHIPYYLCRSIERIDFTQASLYQVLQTQYALSLYHAVETIEAILVDKASARHLLYREKQPGYRITRLSFLDNGFPFEYTTSITRADKCLFRLDLYNNPTPAKNAIDFAREMNLR